MDVLSDKPVVIRKPHQCFACLRNFGIGTTMRRQVNNYDGVHSVYSCETCDVLMSEFHDWFYDDGENVFHEGCVHEHYKDFGVEDCTTPEQLLQGLRKIIETVKEKI